MKSKPLILLGTPRSGTTHILSLVSKSSQICTHGELFSRGWGNEPLSSIKKYVRHFNIRECDPLESFAAELEFKKKNQKLTHDFFWDQCDNEYFFYKILQSQVSDEFMDSLCEDERISKILIKRDPVHSFISRQKAWDTKTWGGINTTDIKPHINLKKLYNHYVSYMDFYKNVEEKSKSIIVIDYDEIHKLADDEQKKLFLIKKLETIGVHLKDFELKGHISTRQDMNTSIKDKIKNGDQVCEFLDSKNIKYQ